MSIFSFKNKNLKLFLTSQFLSLTGGYIQNVALSAYITTSNQKITKLGLFLFVSYLPVFLLSYFTGKLCNKIESIKILRVTEIILFLMSGLLFVLGDMPYGWLLVFGGVWGTVRAFQTPASSSVPKLICSKEQLKDGVASLNLVTSLARAIGPITAGVLYTNFGYRASFFANALSFVPSLILLFIIRIENKPQNNKEEKMQLCIPLFVLVFTVSLVGTGYNIIFTGISENLSLSRIWFSVFMALIGIGAAAGALIFKRQIFLSALGIALSSAVLGFSKSLFITVPVIAFYGMCDYLFFTSALTKIQTDNSAGSVPRAMGIYTAVTTGALPLGYLLQSFVSERLGIVFMLFLSAAIIGFVYLLFFKKIH